MRYVVISPLIAGFLLLAISDGKVMPHILLQGMDYSRFQTGDIIFRQGKDPASIAVLAGRNKSVYSHVGIVVIEKGEVFVVHAVPAEAKDEIGGVKLDPLDFFVSSERASHIAVMRVLRNSGGRKVVIPAELGMQASKNALNYLGRPFDTDFNLQDNKALYCTELVARAYFPLGVDFYKKLETLQLPFLRGNYLLPQDIFESQQLTKILLR